MCPGRRRPRRRRALPAAARTGRRRRRAPVRGRALVGLPRSLRRPSGCSTASMRCGPGSASARASWSASSSAVVAREASTPIPVARATKSRSGRRRSSSARAAANSVRTARISGTSSRAATKCISEVPALAKHASTPPSTRVRTSACAAVHCDFRGCPSGAGEANGRCGRSPRATDDRPLRSSPPVRVRRAPAGKQSSGRSDHMTSPHTARGPQPVGRPRQEVAIEEAVRPGMIARTSQEPP
jgi:hypothetical protein